MFWSGPARPSRTSVRMNRDQLIGRVDGAWREFGLAFQDLSADVLLEPGVIGHWSVKDLMGHVATWEEESLEALGLIMRGEPTPRYLRYGGINSFNAKRWEEHRDSDLEDTRHRFLTTHARLLGFLRGVPAELFASETRFRRRLRLDTYRHVPEHTSHVLAWRAARGL